MAEFPALPLFTDAYLGDTTHLSTFEHGAYLLLLIVSWRSPGCCLPDDDSLLSRYTRMTRDKWRKVRPILEPFFTIRDGFWHQARLQDELQHLRSQREVRSEAGKAGNAAKSLKRTNRSAANGNAERSQNSSKPNAPTPTPITVDKSTAQNDESDAAFWASAKAYLGDGKASLIGKWVKDHGREATASAIAAAQVERAVNPVEFIQGRFRKLKHEAVSWDQMP